METEKIYCQGTDPVALAALMKDNGSNDALTAMMAGNNNWNNNPFIYLVWMMFANRMWGNNGCDSTANFTAQLDSIRNQMSDNQNSGLLMDAVKGNNIAISQLASNLNCDFNALNGAINDARMGIQNVAGQVGYSAEKVINAINLGDANITSKMQECCCSNKLLIQQMGYEGQLRDQANTSSIVGRIDQLANGIQQGFASVGYETQRQTCDIINASNANTQRILDTLNGHWSADLQNQLNKANLELSQSQQTAALIAALKTTA